MLRLSNCLLSLCIAILAACPLLGQVMDSFEQRPGGYGDPLVGASATRDTARFVALTLAARMRLEVLSATGETLYDSGFASGSRLEWQLRDQRGALLRDGLYGCIVTVQEPGGSWGHRRGVFRITQGMASFQETEPSSPGASEALDRESLTILRAEQRPAFTVLSHDGSEGWVESASGGLSFYAGASARERDRSPHLRVSPEGRVGIGVSEPGAKLDVAGLIRTSEGILFPDGTILRSAAGAGGFAVFAAGTSRAGQEGGLGDAPPTGFGAPVMGGSPAKDGAAQRRMASTGGGFGPVYATEGSSNNFFGTGAGAANTSGSQNSFFGGYAGYANTTGSQNSFFGKDAGYYNTTGNYNSFFGLSAGAYNTTGSYNSFFGRSAGYANTTGNYNSFFGLSAGAYNTTGSYNSFFGGFAGLSNTTGGDNSFFGRSAGYSNTSGGANSFFGKDAGYANTTGDGNSFFGGYAGLSNTTGASNSFFGVHSAYKNTTGSWNSIFGREAGFNNTTGFSNSFFGRNAGYSNTTGQYNSLFGDSAGNRNTTGNYNSFFGLDAGYYNTTGTDNSFFGRQVGYYNTTGNYNSFFGMYAGLSNTTEHNNSFIGAYSNGAVGITNATAIGYRAQVTGSNRLVLGSADGVNGATADTFVGIGTPNPDRQLAVEGVQAIARFTRFYPAPDAFSATFGPALLFERARGTRVAPGNIGGGDYLGKLQFRGRVGGNMAEYGALTFIATDTSQNGRLAFVDRDLTTERFSILNTGNVGIGTSAPQERLHVVGNLHLTGMLLGPSDARLKKDVRDLRYGLREVLQLRPVSWLWENQPDARPGLGLIAQEVQSVVPELVEGGKGEADAMSLSYLGLVPVLVKAIQQQQENLAAALERKDSEIALLKSRVAELDMHNAALDARIAALELWIERLTRQEEKHQR